MWRRIYLILLGVRLYFALSASYLHPDEHFQGPEVIAGSIFSYPIHKTWEFSVDTPVRSVFPLWIVYGLPMYTLRCLWDGVGKAGVPPMAVYWTLRLMMFALSFVFQDWAILELIPKTKHRRFAIILVASSYVTWTYQSHTFSNSVETLLVLWSLVVISRFAKETSTSSLLTPIVLGFLTVVGLFNRITFGVFMVIPLGLLLLNLIKRPIAFIGFSVTVAFTALVAVTIDTSFYQPENSQSFLQILRHPVIAPYNLLRYNMSHSNLAEHGLHPYYRHFLCNLPQLLGPALYFLFHTFYSRCAKFMSRLIRKSRPTSPVSSNDSSYLSHDTKGKSMSKSTTSLFSSSILFLSALTGCVLLSILPHQEARFLLPAVPLLLASVRPPRSSKTRRIWIAVWLAFNTVPGLLMGVFHQGGVIPVQGWLGEQFGRSSIIEFGHSPLSSQLTLNAPEVFWWKTYSPPSWLMNGANDHVKTIDLKGMPKESFVLEISAATSNLCRAGKNPDQPLPEVGAILDSTSILDHERAILLVAPLAADIEDVLKGMAGPDILPPPPSFKENTVEDPNEGSDLESSSIKSSSSTHLPPLILHREHYVHYHIGLDDLDFAGDGIFGTLRKVILNRGLVVWSIRRRPGTCDRQGADDPSFSTLPGK